MKFKIDENLPVEMKTLILIRHAKSSWKNPYPKKGR